MASHPLGMLRAMESLWQLVVLTQVPATLSGPQRHPGLLPRSNSAPLPPQSLNRPSDSPPYSPSNTRVSRPLSWLCPPPRPPFLLLYLTLSSSYFGP